MWNKFFLLVLVYFVANLDLYLIIEKYFIDNKSW